MKNILKKFGMLIVAGSLFVACGQEEAKEGAQKEVQVKLWVPFSGPDGVQMEKIVNEYNKSQQKDKINFQIIPQSEYYKTLDLNLATESNGPDMVVMHGDMMLSYINKGLLKDLDEFLAQNDIGKRKL